MKGLITVNEIYERGLCVEGGRGDLFFSEKPDELTAAQAICFRCTVRIGCLEAALENSEDWGVWGGVIFWDGEPFYRKRSRGRPRKADVGIPLEANRNELWDLIRSA